MEPGRPEAVRSRHLPPDARAALVLVVRLVAVLVAAGWGSQLLEARWGLDRWTAAVIAPVVVGALAAPLLVVLVARPALALVRRSEADRVAREAELVAQADYQEFDGALRRAFELARDEATALEVVARAGEVVSPGAPVELLLADSSEAHLRLAVWSEEGELEGCNVVEPWACPAMASGRMREFSSSRQLDTCPQLRKREDGDRSALCVPVNFRGRALGVLHRVGEPDVRPSDETVQRLRLLGGQTGATLGMLRAFAQSQVQASTDTLTGLLNRRSLLDNVQAMHGAGTPYAVLMTDLDRFKELNDVHGHEAGDRALRLFAKVLKDSVRDGDLVSRYGGEEFLVVLRGLDTASGARVGERIRTALGAALSTGSSPRFTTSVGVADSQAYATFDDAVRAADAALFVAKHQGRDQVCTASAAAVPEQREPSSSEAQRDACLGPETH
jgi:diguanylate cyclase (GGDEF)-like protein